MCNDGEPWGDWTLGDWWGSEPTDTRLAEIEKVHKQILELEKEIDNKKESVKEMIFNLEKELYNGLIYREYLKKLQSEPVIKDNIKIKIVGEMIYGEYEIQESNRRVVLGYDVNIQFGKIGSGRMYTPKKDIEVPKKYEKEFEELKAECHKLQVDDFTGVWRRVYNIDIKKSNI